MAPCITVYYIEEEIMASSSPWVSVFHSIFPGAGVRNTALGSARQEGILDSA